MGEQLVNEWLLSDYFSDLVDPLAGGFHGLHQTVEHDAPKDAKRVAVRFMSWKRKEMGGQGLGFAGNQHEPLTGEY